MNDYKLFELNQLFSQYRHLEDSRSKYMALFFGILTVTIALFEFINTPIIRSFAILLLGILLLLVFLIIRRINIILFRISHAIIDTRDRIHQIRNKLSRTNNDSNQDWLDLMLNQAYNSNNTEFGIGLRDLSNWISGILVGIVLISGFTCLVFELARIVSQFHC